MEQKFNEVALEKFTSRKTVDRITIKPGAQIWELYEVLKLAAHGARYEGPEIVLDFSVSGMNW
jgi:hypothetical protein